MTGTPPRGGSWAVRVARHIPTIVLAEPWAIFIKSLCIVSGLTTFAGPAPGSIEQALPPLAAYGWAVTLVAGAGSALYGLLRPRSQRIEISGLIWLGTAAVVYALAILLRFRIDGLIAGGIVLGFGAAALVRALAVYVTYEVAREAAQRAERR